ncbi:LOW QUALITY PROTEIN: uncharacterized protein [Amphiura filiformis]|uniref:LOW QUALITY PROTEIN: uncharacterized protein n=1 Tax=Amphiura filiformis TaxID=82378 RepID=UPI003B21171E
MKLYCHSNLLYLITLCLFLYHYPQCNAVVLINEVNAHNPGTDNEEFIELYNNGDTQVSLDEYTVVLYNGRGRIAYAIIPLQNGVIPPNGYYTMGNQGLNPDRLLSDIDGDGLNILQNGPDAVALYRGNTTMFTNGMQVTNTSLVDAVVYNARNNGGHHRRLADVLTPGERTVHEDRGHIEGGDESISRCGGMDARNLTQFRLAPLTPGRANNCSYFPPTEPPTTPLPRTTPPSISQNLFPKIVINEFDTAAGVQFIELYDLGVGGTSLDGVVVVFYSEETLNAYASFALDGFETDDQGYFVIGQSDLQLRPDLILPTTLSRRRINAIALHYGESEYIREGSPVTNRNLMDAVVYGGNQRNVRRSQNFDLIRTLLAGQVILWRLDAGTAWGRCRGWLPTMISSFAINTPTPAVDNNCASSIPDIVLNEVNAAAEGDAAISEEFVEIFDGGIGHYPLDGIVLVAYNGKNDAAYVTYDLTGYATDERGFAVLGAADHSYVTIPVEVNPRTGFIQAGPDAIALHLGPAPRFGRGSQPTSYNLIDAIIYGTGDKPDVALQHALLPLQPMVNEIRRISDIDHSVSRCEWGRRNASAWGVGPVTPGALNRECVRNGTTVIETIDHYRNILRINEIHLTKAGLSTGEYLELYDSGLGNVPLDQFTVVVYNGNGDQRSTTLLYLDGYATDSNGFFVIGSSFLDPTPQYSLNTRTILFPSTSGAVAIYKVPQGGLPTFVTQSIATREGLVDAVLFGDNTVDFTLVESLAAGSVPITMETITDETSIVRCFSHDALSQFSFVVNQSTPSAANVCPYPPVVLNEVNIRSQGNDMGEFIELSSLGRPGFPLNNLQVVLWKGNSKKAYSVIKIDGRHTDEYGYFLIGYQGLYAPRPDITPFDTPRNNIRDGPNAVTLHSTKFGKFRENMRLNKTGFIDGVVYYINPDRYSQDLVNFFTPDMDPVMEYHAYSERDESINRCDTETGTMWQLAHITPKDHNYCPSRNAELVINEISLVNDEQYIELWDKGAGYTSLDDFVVVLYGEDNLSYWSIPLLGYMTNSRGYFVMGVASIRPLAQFVFANGFMRTRYGAITVYKVSPGTILLEGAGPSTEGLVDAIVYCLESVHNPLSNVLIPNSMPVQSALLQISGQSLSRCFSHDLLSSDAFAITSQTPRDLNSCPVLPNDIVINEINVEQPRNRSKEFIELFDGGNGNTPLTYLTLVLFNGHISDKSYMTFDLDGYHTNDKGLFCDWQAVPQIGNYWTAGGLLQDGPDAIVLYRAPAGAFPYMSDATPNGLIDAVVYSTGDEDSHSLIDTLMPGHSMIKEDEEHRAKDETISRCLGMQRLDSTMYILSKPTPGRRNNCTGTSTKFETTVIINEINVDMPGTTSMEFVELYDGGVGDTPLAGMILVFFNGANQDRSYLEVDFTDERTNTSGYFVIGTINVTPTPNIIIPDNAIQNGPDAVALYHATTRDFLRGTIATSDNLIDVVVYGPSTNQDQALMGKLSPSQVQLQESLSEDTADWSLSRCSSNQVMSMMAFKSAPSSPGAPNQCSRSRSALPSPDTIPDQTLTSLIINEVYYSSSNTDSSVTEYVELKGPANTPLDDYTLVTFTSDGFASNAVKLTNQQTSFSSGIITIATRNMASSVDLTVSFSPFIQRGKGAVALYQDVGEVNVDGNDMVGYRSNLVDALVYTDDLTALTNVLSQRLIPDSGSFYPGDLGSQPQDISISRCTCCTTKTSSVFTLTSKTPGQDNVPQCPAQNYSQVIQMKLINGDYGIWSGNTMLVAELKNQIAAGINEYCQCGFNVNYLIDDKILNGSVIYQANMLASSTNQSQMLYDSYVRFIHEVKKVKVHGAIYLVDNKCVSDCMGSPSAVKKSGSSSNKGAVAIAVSILMVVLVTAVVVVIYLLIRHKNLLQ